MPFLPPNQQRQSTEGIQSINHFTGIVSMGTWVTPLVPSQCILQTHKTFHILVSIVLSYFDATSAMYIQTAYTTRPATHYKCAKTGENLDKMRLNTNLNTH